MSELYHTPLRQEEKGQMYIIWKQQIIKSKIIIDLCDQWNSEFKMVKRCPVLWKYAYNFYMISVTVSQEA